MLQPRNSSSSSESSLSEERKEAEWRRNYIQEDDYSEAFDTQNEEDDNETEEVDSELTTQLHTSEMVK
jgi:hypothetical protein